MELNGLESEDTGVKTQMAVINKPTEDKPTQQKTATTNKEATNTKNSAQQHIARRPMSLL